MTQLIILDYEPLTLTVSRGLTTTSITPSSSTPTHRFRNKDVLISYAQRYDGLVPPERRVIVMFIVCHGNKQLRLKYVTVVIGFSIEYIKDGSMPQRLLNMSSTQDLQFKGYAYAISPQWTSLSNTWFTGFTT